MSATQILPSHLSLTCRTEDVAHFLPLGLEAHGIRGALTDLVDPHDLPRDLREERRRIAEAGLPFYGYATIGHPLHPARSVPVVFAAHGATYCETVAAVDGRGDNAENAPAERGEPGRRGLPDPRTGAGSRASF